MRLPRWATLITFALVSGAATPALAVCPGGCSGGDCVLDGITNSPLGSANLSLSPDCHLIVGGISSSGFDGVVQSALNSVYMVTTLATPNFSGSVLGTRAEITQLGTAGGVAGRTLSVTTIVNVSGALVRADMDCSTISVANYSIEIYDAAGLVFAQPLTTESPILVYPKTDMVSMACAILENGDLYTTMSLGSSVPITIQMSQSNLGPFTGTCVKLRAFSPAVVPTLQESIVNRFKDTGPVEIAGLFAGSLPAVDTVCPLAPVPARKHTWGALKLIYR